MAAQHPEKLEPEVGEEISWETADHWKDFETAKEQAARVPELEEIASRRLRNDKRFRKWLRQNNVSLPPGLEKQ